MPQLSTEARDLNWLVGNFAKHPRGGPRDGRVGRRAAGRGLTAWTGETDQLAAIASGVASLTQGGARCIDGGLVKQTVVEMDRGLLVVMAISDGSCLTVPAASSCDVGVVAYEMTVLVTRAGDVLTPAYGPSSKPPSRHERPTSPGGRQGSSSSSVLHRQEANSSQAGQA